MDPQLPAQLVQFLAPFLPYLLKGLKLAGQEAAKKLGEKAGEQGFEQAKALWDKLRPKVEARPAALEAAQDAAAHPDDEDALAALRLQLKKLLAEDQALAQELARLLPQSGPAGQTVIASGDRSVAIGGNVSGSVIVTGDQNVVHQGKHDVSFGQGGGATTEDRSALPQKSKGISMIPVESSMVDSVGYDEERRLLQVVFTSGRVYCYEDVPPEVFQGLLAAESKGQYMRACIIDVYPYRRGPCRKGR
jgi:hypothetical protein